MNKQKLDEMVRWIQHQFHSASDRKRITYIGVGITLAALACSQFEPGTMVEWPWVSKTCAVISFLGTLVTALGKGLGDRREYRSEEESLRALREAQDG